MDRFDAMRAFVQVVDSGSYTRAARQLDRHKATVSQQIQQLEDRLGTRLLARTTRSVTPTTEGLTYYRHARTILEQVDEAEAMLRKGTSAPAGHLRVNVPVAMGRLVFAPEIRSFLERHPRITLELGCSDRAVDLVGEGADCALRGGVLDSQLSTRPVGDRRFVLYAEPHCIDGRGLPDIPDDLVGVPVDAGGDPRAGLSNHEGARLRFLRDTIVDVQAVRHADDVWFDDFGNLVWVARDPFDGVAPEHRRVIYFDGHTDTVWPLRDRPWSVVVLGKNAGPFKRSTGTDHARRASATP